MAGDHLREGGFAGAVRAHDGVDFAFRDVEGDALEDFGAVFEGGVEVLDVQAHGVGRELEIWRFEIEITSGEFAAQGDFDVVDDGAGREVEDVGEVEAGLEIHVVDHAGRRVVEMAVLAEVRAVAGGFAVEIDLPDDAVLHERFEAVVNGGQREVRKLVLGPHEDLVGGRVIPVLDENAVNLLPLPRHAQPGDLIGNRRRCGVNRVPC